MSYNNHSGNPQGGSRQKKEIFNQWQAIGILRARSADENEPLKFIPWRSGGGVINANLKITEQIGVDEGGNPKTSKVSVPVSIKTNKNITAQQLQSIVSGTKVRVVGRLKLETYESHNTKKTTLVADIYVLDILEQPMHPAFGGYPQATMPQPQYQPQYPQGYFPGQYPPQGVGPQYQAGPQNYPVPQQAPQGYYQGQYVPQGSAPQYPQANPQTYPGQQQPSQMPPWFQQPQEVEVDDLPPA